MNAVDFVKQEYLNGGIVMDELIVSMLRWGEVSLSEDEIYELLCWSGDEEYVTVDDIIDEV